MTITGTYLKCGYHGWMAYMDIRRVEPNVEFYCDLDYDPFLFMQENNKKYGMYYSPFRYLISYQRTAANMI